MKFPWINDVIAAVPEGYVPKLSPLGEDNEVVGTVPEHLRPLFSAFAHIGDTVREKHDAHCAEEGEHNEEKCAPHAREMDGLIRQYNILRNIFYATLETELGLDPETNHGVCENWQIVSIRKVEEPIRGAVIVIGTMGDPNPEGDNEPEVPLEHHARSSNN